MAAGGTAVMEPADISDAGRLAVIVDPEGAVIGVWQAKDMIGGHLVNEPGTWNFSELNTRDPEGAAAFYGAVFGWERVDVDIPEGSFSMFRLPGYGDHLERARPGPARAPGRRRRLRGLRGHGRLAPSHGGGPDPEGTPAHWSITFATDDADAAAERAASLGGTVLMPPFDAPWVRMTVLRDPQGAVFTASKYVPPS